MPLNTKEYYDRDLSWLRFNHRVLQEAADKGNPLYERIRFLAIFSSNLDEFFKVRVSDIRQIKQLERNLRKRLVTKPNKLLKEIKNQVHVQQEELGAILKNQIIPELKTRGIELIGHTSFNGPQKKIAKRYLKELLLQTQQFEIAKLTKRDDTILIENEQLYLVSLVKGKKMVVVKIPENQARFVLFPKEKNTDHITFIDDIFKYNLTHAYRDTFYSLKISRDAELYIDNEYSGDLLTKIKDSLKNRITGQVTRALIDAEMPKKLVDGIKKLLDINETDIIRGGRYHNFRDFFKFPNPENKLAQFEAFTPVGQIGFARAPNKFDAIKTKDRLFYFPYESFDGVVDFLNEAAEDGKVTQIKITLYRISDNSAIAETLLKAVKNGKDIYVFMECKARFDEENNIKWGQLLEANGAKVQYSHPGIKVHSKIIYVVRNENGESKSYCYIATGNFNEKTAKVYTDFGLLTAKEEITKEIAQVFQVLKGEILVPKIKNIIVSPFTTRTDFKELIETEIENALNGKKAYIILKLNSLQDEKMITLLYKASTAGVNIRLIVRGICCLVPGIKDQSENIRATSIVHRFLEHGRVYIFGNGGNEKLYIGSADFMTRNLDHRIEVITPILDKDLHTKIKAIIEAQIEERTKARVIDSEQKNNYLCKLPKRIGVPYFTNKTVI